RAVKTGQTHTPPFHTLQLPGISFQGDAHDHHRGTQDLADVSHVNGLREAGNVLRLRGEKCRQLTPRPPSSAPLRRLSGSVEVFGKGLPAHGTPTPFLA